MVTKKQLAAAARREREAAAKLTSLIAEAVTEGVSTPTLSDWTGLTVNQVRLRAGVKARATRADGDPSYVAKAKQLAAQKKRAKDEEAMAALLACQPLDQTPGLLTVAEAHRRLVAAQTAAGVEHPVARSTLAGWIRESRVEVQGQPPRVVTDEVGRVVVNPPMRD